MMDLYGACFHRCTTVRWQGELNVSLGWLQGCRWRSCSAWCPHRALQACHSSTWWLRHRSRHQLLVVPLLQPPQTLLCRQVSTLHLGTVHLNCGRCSTSISCDLQIMHASCATTQIAGHDRCRRHGRVHDWQELQQVGVSACSWNWGAPLRALHVDMGAEVKERVIFRFN